MMKKTISVLAIAALVVFSGFTFTESFAQFVFAQTTNSTTTNSTTTVNLTNSTLSLTNSTNITTTNSTLTTTNSTTTTEPIVPVEETFTVFQEQQQQQQSFPIISQQPSVDLSDLVYETYTDDFIIRSYQNYDEVIDLNERVVKVISTPLRINTGDSWGYIKSWEDINNLYIQSIKGAITLDKNACAFTMYDGLEISPSNIELGSISWSPRYAQVGTDDWIVIDELNDAQCTVVSEQIDDYNLVITLTKDTSNFRLEHLIEINSFEGIKETYRIFNDNPLLTNHKFSATQTIHVPNTITIPMIIPDELTTIELPYSEDYDFTSDAIKNVTLVPEMTTEIITTNGTQTTTIPQFYKVEYTPYIATSQTFDIESLSFDGVYLDRNWIVDNHLMVLGFGEHLSYDIEKGLDQLWSINLFNENSIPKVSLDYANNAQLIPVGGVFEVDPTFYNSYSTASTTPTQVSVPVGIDVTFKVWGAGGGSGRNGGGGGGGYSGIFSSSTLSQATAIVVGGAGGGGTSCGNTSVSYVYGVGCAAGGSGGGTTAMAGYDTTYYYGGAGSQTAGGAGHTYSGGTTGASGTALGGGSGSNNFSTNTSTWGGGVGGAGGYISGTIDTTNLPEANLYVLVGGGGGAGGTSGTYTGGVGGVNGGGAGGIGAGGGGAGYYGGAGGGSACCGGYGTGGGGSNFYNTNFVTIGNNLIGGAGKANTARTNDDLRGQLATVPPLTADTDWSNNGGAGGGYTGTASNGYDGLVVLSYAYVEVPDPPANFAANDGTPINITYSAPAYDGGASVYGYNIYRANAVSGVALPDNGGSNGGLDFTDNELLLHGESFGGQPDFTDDFTTDPGFSYSNNSGATASHDSVNGEIDIAYTTSNPAWAVYDLGTPLGNSWVLKFDLKRNPTNDGNKDEQFAIGLFDNSGWSGTPGNPVSLSSGDLAAVRGVNDYWCTVQGVDAGSATTGTQNTHCVAAGSGYQTYILSYDGSTLTLTSPSQTPTQSGDWSISKSGISGLQYLMFAAWQPGGVAWGENLSVDNIEIYDGVTSVPTPTATDNSPNSLTVTANSGTTTTGVISNAISAPNLSVTSSLLPDATDSFTVGSWVKHALTRVSTLDGTQIGGVTTSATGKIDSYAWDFDGSNDYVNVSGVTLPTYSSTDTFSVSTWINMDTLAVSPNHHQRLFHWYDGTKQWNLLIMSSGAISFDNTVASQGVTTSSTGLINTGTWYHVVAVKTGANTYKIYLNGVDQSTTNTGGGNPAPSTQTFRIGADIAGSGSDGHFNGRIDEFSVFTRALTSSEVSALYNGGTGVAVNDSSLQVKPETNSIFIETDTANRWWFDGTDWRQSLIYNQQVVDNSYTFVQASAGNGTRAGIKVASGSGAIGKSVRYIRFKIVRTGSPGGILYCRVRDSSNNILAQTSETANDVSTSIHEHDFDLGSYVTLSEGDRIMLELTTGSSGNGIWMRDLTSNTMPSDFEKTVYNYSSVYVDSTTTTVWGVINYTDL